MNKPLVFISYSHQDEVWKDRLLPHLKSLEMAEEIVLWDDRKIDGGETWYPEIQDAMATASVAVCLISANYLSSQFCVKEEVPYLLQRRQEENLLFLPVLISPCLWKPFRWLSDIQMLPRDGKAISSEFKDDWDRAFQEVAELIWTKIQKPHYQPTPPPVLWSSPEKVDLSHLPETGNKLFGRQKELNTLDAAWESADTHIVSFIAWGGVGKSTLINHWLSELAKANYKGAKCVFAWSFYSQGTKDQVTSSDTFLSAALSFFGETEISSRSAWDKGQRLAELMGEQKTLLVLDGMEPLQSAHTFDQGKLKDQGLTALLRALARQTNGLCVITSRETITDLEKYPKKVKQLNLETLSTEASSALLRVGSVQGNDLELETAVAQFGHHALAINLLSVYLKGVKGHHISEAQQIPDLAIPEAKGKHPRRVIEALFQRVQTQPAGDLLKMFGFFDRPAEYAALQTLMEAPAIAGLTDHLGDTGEAGLLKAIDTLRHHNLVTPHSDCRPDSLDCHPLIREHFGEHLKKHDPTAWQTGHARLYNYYQTVPEEEYPDTLEEMEPLFAAVRHGCLARKSQDALDGVYWKRIRRSNEHYLTKKLGAFGANLSCLSYFFESLWDQPASDLTEHRKAVTLGWTGFALRAVGQLSEATQPMKAGLAMLIKDELWKNAAIAASNLSELHLTLGAVFLAQDYGAQSVTFADRSEDGFQKEVCRTTHADALHQAGERSTTEQRFREVEAMQKKRIPDDPYLYSLRGFQFCDLLLSMGKIEEVLERAQTTVQYEREGWYRPLDITLDKLTIGKALMQQTITSSSKSLSSLSSIDFSEAETYLNQAMLGLRGAGTLHRLPWGLLARATLFRYQKAFLKAWQNLEEVWEIATDGQMRLFLCDYHLEASRLIRQQLETVALYEIIDHGETVQLSESELRERFAFHLKEAERLITETGYRRRDGELAALQNDQPAEPWQVVP